MTSSTTWRQSLFWATSRLERDCIIILVMGWISFLSLRGFLFRFSPCSEAATPTWKGRVKAEVRLHFTHVHVSYRSVCGKQTASVIKLKYNCIQDRTVQEPLMLRICNNYKIFVWALCSHSTFWRWLARESHGTVQLIQSVTGCHTMYCANTNSRPACFTQNQPSYFICYILYMDI